MRVMRGMVVLAMVWLMAFTACDSTKGKQIEQDQVHKTELKDIRMGDGVPLNVLMSVRWRIEDGGQFTKQFDDPSQYAMQVLEAKAREMSAKIANGFPSTAAVFRQDREKFVQAMKDGLSQKLSEKGISIKEVIISDIHFPKNYADALQDQMHTITLADIRLGDGVPLEVSVTIRWRIEEGEFLSHQFADPSRYAGQVFDAKARELATKIANGYPSAAAVFRKDREKFVQEVREGLAQKLGEKGIGIKEVMLSEIQFPRKFTDALEVAATKEQEMEMIRQKSAIELEDAKAAQAKAQADGQVQVERAKAEGKVAEINAQTEEKRRMSQIAKAETEAQVLVRKSKAEVERQKLLAQQETERQRDLNQVELEKQNSLKDLEVKRQKDLDQVQIAKEKEQAALCASNPAYASFLVNRELASKVQIAVLPVGTDSGVLGNIIHGSMGSSGPRK